MIVCMQWVGVCVFLGVSAMAAPSRALQVTHGGPYEVDEGSEIELSILLEDVVGHSGGASWPRGSR
jgi:hypothetical protein